MSILKVARMGHPVLRTAARPIERGQIKSAPIQKLIDDMIETMVEYHGVGLAGPQIHESLRLFVAMLDAGDGDGDRDGDGEGDRGGDRIADGSGDAAPGEAIVLINPEITPIGRDIAEDWEGCLSIPDIRGRVPRAREIKVRGLDRKGERIEIHAHDYPARVIQHETDHLDGVLFLDRMRSFETLAFLDEYSRYWTPDDQRD